MLKLVGVLFPVDQSECKGILYSMSTVDRLFGFLDGTHGKSKIPIVSCEYHLFMQPKVS